MVSPSNLKNSTQMERHELPSFKFYKMNKIYKFFLLAIISWLSATSSYAQAVLSTESFDATTFAPTGWSIKPDLGAQNVWVRRTASTVPSATPHSGAAFARFSSRTANLGTKQLLVSRPIDYTNRGTNAANLSFWMFRDNQNTASDSITVWVNVTDTLDGTALKLGTIVRNRIIAMPDTQAVAGWYQYSFSIPTTYTGTNTRFIFEGTSDNPGGNQGAHMYIDDVEFDEFPIPCTGTPSIGNIVSSVSLICDSAGSAVLSQSTPLGNVSGIQYTWEMSSSATGPWTVVGGNTSTLATGILNATTYFQCTASCSYSSLTYTTPVFTQQVSASPSPLITVSPSSAAICPGATTGATLAATGAVTYNWTPATGLNVTSGNVVIALPTVSTQYTVIGIDSIGCQGSNTVNVTMANLPNVNISANPSDTVCEGETVILNSIPGGPTNGNTYAWSDGAITRRDTIVASAANPTYSVIVTNAAGCSVADTITLFVNPPATANFGWTSVGNTYTFIDSSSTATGWSWNFGDGNSSTLQNPVYTFSGPGVYQVTLLITGTSCSDDSVTKTIVIGPESIIDIDGKYQVSMYPNPVSSNLFIDLDGLPNASVRLINALGQEVSLRQNLDGATIGQVSLTQFPAGFYIVELTVNGKTYPTKIYKQ